jgi:hypothetical protein
VCEGDALEPNNRRDRSTLITGQTLSALGDPNLRIADLNLHHAGDEDWISVLVDSPAGNPILTATVSGALPTADYEVSAWYSCPESSSEPTCTLGDFDDTQDDGGCVGARSVSLQSNCDRYGGGITVRVRAPSGMSLCVPYQLDVDIR